MESPDFSLLSSLRGEFKHEDYIQPHYKESYRLAIDCLVKSGRDSYRDFLKGERVGSFLSEEELLFITDNAQQPPPPNPEEEITCPSDSQSSSGTYWPMHSDSAAPDLDLGWPEVMHDQLQTNIDVLFHPARQNSVTIKEVVRKKIQEARQVIAIVMDKFTDVDIFKEVVDASIRGVPVYVLLDHFHLKSFLKMAENQDVIIQQLRNMRVRTVKGQEYLCRSGAKFHGAMEQKFLLVDCHTTIYGSYSFTWSFEKINISMVQVITGHLVKSYDEEFRTLYARSSVPSELCTPEGLYQHNGSQGRQISPKSYSAPKIERRDHLRRSLDTVYRKTCERQLGNGLFEEQLNELGPLIENGIQMTHISSPEAANFLKRHSYAGERQEGCMPQNIRPRGSNWNISKETANTSNNHLKDNYLQVPLMHRGQNMRQSYNGNDQHLQSMQLNMPTLENTSKSYMRSLRIESYLKNPDVPFGDSCDNLDQFEFQDRASSFIPGGKRSSLAFRPPIMEQMEPDRRMNNSMGSSPVPNSPLHYSSMQWNATPENRMSNEEFMMKRQSLQILEDPQNNTSYGLGRNQPGYMSLGRAKGRQMITTPDILSDSWYKRHSVADPRSDTEYARDSINHMYGGFARMQVNRNKAGINEQNGGYRSNLNEEQRSVSHFDVMSVSSSSSSGTWQEPPSRTVSAAALDTNSKDLSAKSGNTGSKPFFKRSTKKIKSLLNIPEKKEHSSRAQSVTSVDSTDTLTAEDEQRISYGQEQFHQRPTTYVQSPEYRRNHPQEDYAKSSKPRFRTEEHQNPPQMSLSKGSAQKKPYVYDNSTKLGLNQSGSWNRDRAVENRVYSRFEPFCSTEKKYPAHGTGNTHSQDKPKASLKGEAASEHNLSRGARGPHENKLEKFIQRMGHLIHKSK